MVGKIYPACERVEESPEYTVLQNVLHLPTPIEENGQHALPQLYYASVLLRFCWFRSVVGHGVLLGYRGYDEGGVQSDQLRAQRGELRVPALYLEAL
jgi:hypothetical protein